MWVSTLIEESNKTKAYHDRLITKKIESFFLECIKYIDKVVVFDSDYELETCISMHKIDCLIVGSEYKDKKVIGCEYAKNVMFFDRVSNYSTTKILEEK